MISVAAYLHTWRGLQADAEVNPTNLLSPQPVDMKFCIYHTVDQIPCAMMDLWNQERTIQGVAKECRGLLTDFMVHLSHHDPLSIGTQLQDELGRFNLWAANIDVFAPLQASLDFRLIDVPDIKSQFLRQLDTMKITLTQCEQMHFEPQEIDS